MQQDDVDVASGSELAAPIAANRYERDVVDVTEKARQPTIDERAVCSSKVAALQSVVLNERGALLDECVLIVRARRCPSLLCEPVSPSRRVRSTLSHRRSVPCERLRRWRR